MKRPFHHLLLLCSALALCVSAQAKSTARWDHVGLGMSPVEVAEVLGNPLIINGSRGYQQWTFDAGGSVMFHQGTVLHWKLPKGFKAPDPAKAPLIAKHMGGLTPSTTTGEDGTSEAAPPPTAPDMDVPPAFMEDYRGLKPQQPKVRSFEDIVKS